MRMPSLHTVVWRETTGWNVTIIQPQWWSKVMCAGRPQNIMLQTFVSSISRNSQYVTSYWHYVLTLYWNTSCILVTCQLIHCIWMTFDWFCTFMSRSSQKEVTYKNWDMQEVRKCVNNSVPTQARHCRHLCIEATTFQFQGNWALTVQKSLL